MKASGVDERQEKQVPRSSIIASSSDGGPEILDQLENEWRELCCEAAVEQPFYRPEWIQAYVRAFLPKATLRLIEARQDGRLRAVLPLVMERGSFSGIPCKKLRSPFKGHAFRYDMTCCADSEREAVIFAVWEHLRQQCDWDVLEFRNVLPGAILERLAELAKQSRCATEVVTLYPSPYVPFGDDSVLRHLPRNARLRTKLRQVTRELNSRGVLRLRRIEHADSTALQRFYDLEASGWKGQEGSAIACSKQTRQFFDEISRQAERFGYLSLYLLEFNDQLIAGHLGFTHAGRYFSPKVAFDEHHKEMMGGHLIVNQILQDCTQRGVTEYDITGDADEWKLKWTSETRSNQMLLLFRKGAWGNFLHAVQFRIKRAVRLLAQKRPKGRLPLILGSA